MNRITPRYEKKTKKENGQILSKQDNRTKK